MARLASKLNRERVEERDTADRCGELRNVSEA